MAEEVGHPTAAHGEGPAVEDVAGALLSLALDSGRLALLRVDAPGPTVSFTAAPSAAGGLGDLVAGGPEPWAAWAGRLTTGPGVDPTALLDLVTTGEPAEFRGRAVDANGVATSVLVRIRPGGAGPGGPLAEGTVSDITDFKRSEHELERRNRLLEGIFSASPDAISLVDAGGTIVYISDAASDVLGAAPAELIGQRVMDVVMVHPDDKATVAEGMGQVLDGSVKHHLSRFRVSRPRGDGVIEVHRHAISGRDGGTSGMVTVLRDVTFEVSLAARASRAEAARADMLAELGRQVLTPLQSVLSLADLAAVEPDPAELREVARRMALAGRHLLELVDETVEVAGLDMGAPGAAMVPVDLAASAREVADLLASEAAERTISLVVGPFSTAPVLAERRRLHQVLVSLASNALRVPAGGREVRLSSASHGGRTVVTAARSAPGSSGEAAKQLLTPGVLAESAARSLEGDGSGLVVSRQLTEAMGGRLGVEVGPAGPVFWAELVAADRDDPGDRSD